MGKILQFKPPRPQLKAVPRIRDCPKCHHRMAIHIAHPNGVVSCAVRGCVCEVRSIR